MVIPGVISLLLFGLRPGIEFQSGSLMTLKFAQEVQQEQLRDELSKLGFGDAIIQRTAEGDWLVRTRELKGIQTAAEADNAESEGERAQIMKALGDRFGEVTLLSFDSVSPIVSTEILRNSTIAVLGASAFIMAYITWAFRGVQHSFRYGASAIFALLHDVLLVLGIFSILGQVSNFEVDSMFVTAILTVVGLSVHDTIVVFDRVRENSRREPNRPFATVVNHSMLQTLGRSLNTSITAILTLVALLLFGGVTIRPFVLTLLVGLTTATYSSIFVASMILVEWENWAARRRMSTIAEAEADGRVRPRAAAMR
jgi:preprotein translocase subunit SecF